MRAFVAIEVPPVAGERPAHLTVKFLGDIDPGIVPALSEALTGALGDRSAFRLVLEGVGAFPSPDRPRVVWAGVTDGHDEVVDLAARVESAAVRVGLAADDRPFAPHVTILRVRGPSDLAKARALLESLPHRRFGEARIAEVILFESELRRDGAVHRPLARFPLAPDPERAG